MHPRREISTLYPDVRSADYRLLFETIPHIVWAASREGELEYCNSAGTAYFGLTLQQLSGDKWKAVVHPDDLAACLEKWEACLRSGTRLDVRYRLRRHDGDYRWHHGAALALRDAQGAILRWFGTCTDVDDQMHAARRIEQQFHAFMDNSPAIAWIKDSRLVYTYASEPFLQRLNRRREDVLGHTDAEIWPEAGEAVEKSRQNDLRVQRERRPLQSVDSARRADGTLHHWLSVKFPLPDARGETGVAGTAIEITKRVEAEAEAQAYAGEARALLDRLVAVQESERKRLATGLHDLIGQNLTALGIWLANLSAALSAGRPAEIAPQIDSMRRTVEQTIEAIRGVMSDLRPPGLEEYGLLPALRAYARDFQASTSLRTTVECAGRPRRLPAPVEMSLFRIAQEALTNAAKHSGGGEARILLEESGGLLRLVVEDDGRGIENPVGARRSGRGGWGLRTIRERAEACGGSLRVEQPGRGTRVIVEMPVRDAD